jgi:O-methyltransferase
VTTVAAGVELPPPASDAAADRYLHLLGLALTGLLDPRPITDEQQPDGTVEPRPSSASDLERRLAGSETFSADAYTMIGLKRLENIRACVEDVLARGVPGDLIEAGVWRGGAAIFMRALLLIHEAGDRSVFVADSFEGLPPPDPAAYPADEGHNFHLVDILSVPQQEVEANFARFGLLDDQVQFVPGWFEETLPALSDHTWSLIRLDGDLYASTMQTLENLYPNLAPGGYLIVDDYALAPCRAAVDDYRAAHGIEEPVTEIDWAGAFWRKEG